MPVAVTYPGVYVEELPSGERIVSGVATSISAFLGRAVSGPLDESITIFNFGDYERLYGGLSYDYPMSYAVRDFFLNGGSQAIIVRLYKGKTPETAPAKTSSETRKSSGAEGNAGKATLKIGNLQLAAANPGLWGAGLSAWIDTDNITPQVAERFVHLGIKQADLFNINIAYQKPGGQKIIERFLNCTVTGDRSPDRIDRVLAHKSLLVRVPMDNENNPKLPSSAPPVTKKPVDDNKAKATGGADSEPLDPATIIGDENAKTGMYLLKHVDLFNLLCIPPDTRGGDTEISVYQEALKFCVERRAMLIVDPPTDWSDKAKTGQISQIDVTSLDLTGEQARNAAVYFPRVIEEDQEMNGQLDTFPACGIIAGVMASTDITRGVWKAPAGEDAGIAGIRGLEVKLTDPENGVLNPVGINCLRNFPIVGPVVWGARTLRGADALADDYKYVPVRRLTLFIEESLYRGTKWAVFEPNDEALWSQLRLSVSTFMADLNRQGAFYSYKVVCDATTTTASDIEHGIVNVLVSFAPVKPAEFVILLIQQQAAKPV